MAMRVACIGGGPGGLFFSTLLKRQLPEAEVVLFERNEATDAFGFGVVFSDATLSGIDEVDPVLRDGLRDFGRHWDTIEVWLKGERRQMSGNGMAAIHRKTLLRLLQERAADAGVDMRFCRQIPSLTELMGFDAVVGADGANSRTREELGDTLGHTAEAATAKFIWFGTTHMFEGLTFVHRQSEFGNFAAHAYPISEDLSTFIVETDEDTWRRAGLDEFDVTQPPGASDEKTRVFLEGLFAEDLAGGTIVANNSRWGTFRTRRTRTWHAGNVVLLGDAVHTAHFSVGSGTKMAMEDAIVLARELAAGHESFEAAFEAYEAERQPQVARIQDSASGGLSWWEHFGRYYDAFAPSQFAFHFFSRSIGIDRIGRRDPALVADARGFWRAEHGTTPLETPFSAGGADFGGRRLILAHDGEGRWGLSDTSGARLPVVADPSLAGSENALVVDAPSVDAPSVDAEVSTAVADLPAGLAAVVVRGGTPLTRRLVAEEARLGRGIPAVIVDEGDEASAETLVLSGRADAVASPLTPGAAL
jgi:salicyloyl-CoA 5-hydroxylase